jgi:hypothetical protein
MSPSGSSASAPHPSSTVASSQTERQEWIYRGVAGAVLLLLFWLSYRARNDGLLPLFLAPFIVGAVIAALRVGAVSDAVNAFENRLRTGSAKAAARQGKFARFFQRPFFGSCLAIWRSTARISDAHLQAGVRVAALIFVSAIAVMLLVMALYIIVAVVAIIVVFAIIGWILSLNSRSPGRATGFTRQASDWLGRPKQEHFDSTGQKVGESRPEGDWLGRQKVVHRDAEGNIVGESRPDTDWLGNPKTVHRDADGSVTGESRPDTDLFGNPKTVHTDAEGTVTGESREEADLLGRKKTVHYEK